MRDILTGSITLFLLFFGVYQSQAQSFWTETFGAGCNSGVIADGFSSTNGIWEVTSSVANTDANVWYISSAEGGAGVGNCSEGCVSNPLLDKPTLHIGSHNTDLGAIYTSDQVTDVRAESPIINCKSRCNIELSFEYFKSGSEDNENLSVWYNDSTGWVELEITPTTSLGACVSNNGLWTQRTVNLPASADNNPKVQVGFRWENDGAGSGTKPSAAIYNIQLSSSDNTAPIITCPGNQTQDVDPAECSASISDYTGLVAWSDDCTKDANDMTFEQTPSIGSVFSGSNTVTMSVKDFAGNESTCTFTLSIIDTVKPIISCPADFDVYTTSSCEYVIPDYNGEIYIKDNCDVDADLLFAQDIPMGTTLSGHGTTQAVVVSVEDLTGNTRSCSFEITLVDTIKPIMVCPPDQSVNADVNCDYTVVDYLGALTITDNCSVFSNLIIGQNITTGTIVNNGIHAIVLTAEDEAGNVKTCNFDLEVVDVTAPVITSCVPNQVEPVTVDCEATLGDYTGLISVDDACDIAADLVVTQSPAIGSVINGLTTVTLTVTDLSNNSSNCSFSVDVIDTMKPSITCPADFDVYTDISCEYIVPSYVGDVVSIDNCDAIADLTFTQTPVVGTVLSGDGTTQSIEVTVEDLAGNTQSCSFEITLVDTIKPVITCPSNQSVNADINCDYTVLDYTSSLSINDNCSASSNLILGQNIPSGTVVNKGLHAIVVTAEDEAGNIRTCSFDLEVVDVTAPVITSCAPNQVEPVTIDCEATLGDYTGLISVDDACDIAADLVVTQSPAIGSVINGLTTVTLTVTDLSNNFSSCTFDVDVIDTMKPVADCSKDTSVVVNANCEYAAPDVTGLVTGTDNCSSFSNMTLSQNIASGTILTNAQAIDVTMTDESGNSVMCSVQINIIDTIAPVLTCPNLQIVHNGINCNYQITDYTTLAAVTDNCSALTLTQYPSVGTEIGTGDHIVHLLAVDASGNSSTCSFTLSVWENESPTIICPSDIATCDPVVTYDAPIVVENCSNYTLNQDDGTGLTSGDNFPVGVTIQSYLVSDASENTETCSFTVEVFELPDSAKIITLPESYCEQKNVVLEAESVISGTGEWKVIEGTSSVNNEFATTTGVNNLSYGNNTFVWTVSTASCGSQSDTVTIQVFENPTQAFTQDQLVLCNDTLINIAATSPSVGTGSWSEVTGNASFLDPSSANTVLYNLNEGWNEIVWTVSNGACPSTSDTINVFKKSIATIYTPDTTVCLLSDDFTLSGSPVFEGVSALWYVISGGVEFENQESSSPTVTQLNGGKNIVVYGQNHPVCGTTTDTLIVIGEQCEEYNPNIPTVITPNADGRNDLFVIKDLHMLYPHAEVKIVNRWGGLVYESIGYEKPWDGTMMNEGKELEMGTYFYRILLNDNNNREITGPISIIR